MTGLVPAFQPKRDDGRPLWRIAYDHILDCIDTGKLHVGDLISHEELRALYSQSEQESYYQSMGKVASVLRLEHNRSLRSERGSGYRLIGGTAQVEQGVTQKDRGYRDIVKAQHIVQSADLALMSVDERKDAAAVQRGLAALATVAGLTIKKLTEHEEKIQLIKTSQITDRSRVRATEEQMADVRQQMEEQKRAMDQRLKAQEQEIGDLRSKIEGPSSD